MGLLSPQRFGREPRLPGFSVRRQTLQNYVFRRQTITIVLVILFLFVLGPTVLFHESKTLKNLRRPSDEKKPKFAAEPSLQQLRLRPQPLLEGQSSKFHLVIIAPNAEITLCKTLLTASVLGYPVPTILQYNETYDLSQPFGGGKYTGKVGAMYDWLKAQPKAAAQDIVLMVDAYGAFNYHDIPVGMNLKTEADIWFQLGPESVLKRYLAMRDRASEELAERMGKAYEAEKLKQTVFFGAGKRCAPNQPHSAACYAMPESPLPSNLYGPNTDTVMGHNRFSSNRQRFLSAAYAIGPIHDMHSIFQRAAYKINALKDSEGNYKYRADFNRAGSDQAVLQEILGEQELQREVMRRKYLTFSDKAKGLKKRPTIIEGTLVDDVLNPSFSHKELPLKGDKTDEFSMTLDYWSDLGQQTTDSEHDSRWLTYNRPVIEQLTQRRLYDCPPRATGSIPDDMLNTSLPSVAVSDASQFSPMRGWDEIPLYTNICLDTIPAIIHHNGDKKRRDDAWPQLWLQPHARRLVEETLARGEGQREGQRGGAWTPKGYRKWEQLCPAKLEADLYMDSAEFS
ncbi:hypothetical protein HJFPF1_12841 [Paramyrothecium foliicola]|nr:hypothetical protein HJFPF1_12841 [Paramyrothecium foliicola]